LHDGSGGRPKFYGKRDIVPLDEAQVVSSMTKGVIQMSETLGLIPLDVSQGSAIFVATILASTSGDIRRRSLA
jgi:hypothetical protein